MNTKAAHNLLHDWAEFHCRMLETSGLGFGDTITGKARKGDIVSAGRPTSVVPMLDVPRRLLEVDRAVRRLPAKMRTALLYKFGWKGDWKPPMTDAARFKAWCDETGKSSRDTYQRHLCCAIYYVTGVIDRRH